MDNVSNFLSNIQFIVSATYSLNTVDSQIDFSNFPLLTVGDFVLDDAEVEEYLDLCAGDNDANVVGALLRSKVFRTAYR